MSVHSQQSAVVTAVQLFLCLRVLIRVLAVQIRGRGGGGGEGGEKEGEQLQAELNTLRPQGICLSDGPHHRVVVESPRSVHLRKTWTLLPFELLSP